MIKSPERHEWLLPRHHYCLLHLEFANPATACGKALLAQEKAAEAYMAPQSSGSPKGRGSVKQRRKGPKQFWLEKM